MRSSKAVIVVAVVGLVLLVGGWLLTAVGSAGSLRAPAWGGWRVGTSPTLTEQLQQFLAGSGGPFPRSGPGSTFPRAAPGGPLPQRAPSLHGSRCFVGAVGFCSIQACVVPIAAGLPAPACTAAPAPVRAVPVSRP
jgi:hypothetical protein